MGATEMMKAIPKEESAKPIPSESPCDHACDLKGSCCRCVARAPRPGIVPNLHSWWRQRGVPTPTPGAVRWRFYCGTCASLPFSEEREDDAVLPLPFGGVLVHSPALEHAFEIVELQRSSVKSQGSKTCANDFEHVSAYSLPSEKDSYDFEHLSAYSLPSDKESWAVVESPGLVRSASGGSWVLPLV